METEEEMIDTTQKNSKKDKKSSKKEKKSSKKSKKKSKKSKREKDDDYDSYDQLEEQKSEVYLEQIHLDDFEGDGKSKKFTGMMDWKETIDKVILLVVVEEAIFYILFCMMGLWFINL